MNQHSLIKEKLKQYIHKIVELNEEEWNVFVKLFSLRQLNKQEYFAVEGEVAQKIAFVSQGIFRAFYRQTSGQEFNKTFFTSQQFIGALSSLVTQQPNKIYIEALTKSHIIEASYTSIVQLYDQYPKIERLSRCLAERFFIKKEKREVEFVMLDATQRYQVFQEEYPGLENQIAQFHIASYLGISATQLSRIRAKK